MHHALRVTKRTAAGWLFFLASTGCSGLSLAQTTEPRPASPDVAPAAPQKTAKRSLSRYPDTMPASAPDLSTPQAPAARPTCVASLRISSHCVNVVAKT